MGSRQESRARHQGESVTHDPFADPRAVRRRVEQSEGGLDNGSGLGRVEVVAQAVEGIDPDVDVGELQLAHPAPSFDVEVGPLAFLDDDQGGMPEGEVDVPGDQGFEFFVIGSTRRRAAPALGQQAFADRDQCLGEDIVLAREVLVDGRPGDPARACLLYTSPSPRDS